MFPTHLPEAEPYRPGTGEPSLRWGIVGPGWIAGEFASAIRKFTAQRIVAVASRSMDRAAAFATVHGIGLAFGSPEQLFNHPDVDVVYIATPSSEHVQMGLAAIAGGKHVLIEKPLALNAPDAARLADAALAAGVLVMEGMWSRYLPQTSVLRRLVADGVLGDIRAVLADHGQAKKPKPGQHKPGGALVELGIYPVQFDSMILGNPLRVTAVGGMTDTGIDTYSTLVLTHGDNAQSTLYTSILDRTPMTAVISGTEASIYIDSCFYAPTSFTLVSAEFSGPALSWQDPTGLKVYDGLSWEATALAQFVGEGRTESPVHTLDETISILATIDEARAQLAAATPAIVR